MAPDEVLYPENGETVPGVATLDPNAELDTSDNDSGPRCEKCAAPIASDIVAICRHCGWYASLATFVELDPNWDADPVAETPNPDEPRPSHVRVWLNLVPRWGWVILFSMLIVVLQSAAVRLATPADHWLRATWSLWQLAIGTLSVAGCHLMNFLTCATEDADCGVLDMFLRPLKLWTRALQKLPTRLWVANGAACGAVAVVMSALVIGGLPYDRLWDWGFQEPVKQNLMGAVMDRAKQLDSGKQQNLEDAISDFAGSQDLQADAKPPTPPKPRHRTDGVILGYTLDRDGRLATLLIGRAHRGKLVYAGRVTMNMPDEELAELLEKLAAARSLRALIPIDAEATWLQPRFACRVTYTEQAADGRLREVEWERLLGQFELPAR